ncbi:HypC/HybG/HupF family hydrogenase formation chaperone [uncultured Neptuniibacter sp.]|uniref:HypC/HybG/HupF family hydrogenase formation chaperone n=1 Tax=uncultured Neptuniibacter sp. TaxID=502143 RepID=UPI00261AB4D8|nr:HypC/HybG/HupF family hydrogenase formation chaperone [uncultured Neptuniibacter sp.]
MCLGIPMQIESSDAQTAICRHGEVQERVDISLLGVQPPGTWVLVFLGAAREILSEERACQIQNALQAVAAVMQGETADVDSLFSDLLEREPQLPPHLQNNN